MLYIAADALVAEENTAITLACQLADRDYFIRNWFQGYHTSSFPQTRQSLFIQRFDEIGVQNYTDRHDMVVDPTSFALTISKVKLEDDGYFTCRIIYQAELYNQTKVEVYSKYKFDA